ncbi:alpha/beta hydrolase [Leptospira sp. 2 VSF19]|uniref:Alpha/beta hydrolase n=1 Tax=Leptospira soteropolitanensis TaxID=2950025 RepID=A0AAW5VND3_9LEPT|nr:alpha/beta hydrolase [Leptospira soteropolitanensis]MCW7493544.1 alpha/beta hydrolase [Leptospira soteropolitanensis]MCW7500925.1 alpha/beta hydrolase [Leptospira soteropolitanensis]MCW7523395.1 alpha/beta hydrolase [Leptospira soteropolitanensis]MCW7527256.1 alpha/beta hydrolase [Leptospira soteropolitanensis]MCW7531113.1 alpha/beta hydrolase [Leptospira soteropolitanensis]
MSPSTPKTKQKKYKEDFITTKGVKIHLGIWPGRGQTIICLHGLSGNLYSMKPLAERLYRKGYKVISYDLRGRGQSDKPKSGYGFQNHIEDLKGIITHYKIKNPIFFAHSFGCMIALRFAIRYPNEVKAMILMDGGGLLSVQKRLQVLKVLQQSFERLDVIYPNISEYLNLVKNSPLVPNWTKVIEEYFRLELEKTNNGYVCHMPRYVMEEELKEMGGSMHKKNIIKYLLKNPKKVISKMIENKKLEFEKIQTPTLILRATEMNLFPKDDLLPKTSFQSMLQRIPFARGEEIKTNHYGILFEELNERDKAIDLFLKNLKK